jgi:SMC interacting uncharacterized protein involved in chromosome segregation
MDIELLDIAIAHDEKRNVSLRAFRETCGEITDFEEEAKRARADAAAAQKSLTELTQQVAAAQTAIDKLKSEREALEQQIAVLKVQHDELTVGISRIKAMLAA